MLSFFQRGVFDEILNLIESVSEDFPSYSYNNLHYYKYIRIVKNIPFSEVVNTELFRSSFYHHKSYVNTSAKLAYVYNFCK